MFRLFKIHAQAECISKKQRVFYSAITIERDVILHVSKGVLYYNKVLKL